MQGLLSACGITQKVADISTIAASPDLEVGCFLTLKLRLLGLDAPAS